MRFPPGTVLAGMRIPDHCRGHSPDYMLKCSMDTPRTAPAVHQQYSLNSDQPDPIKPYVHMCNCETPCREREADGREAALAAREGEVHAQQARLDSRWAAAATY